MKKAMLIVLGLVGICLFAGARGWLGSDEELGEILEAPRPDATEAIRGGLSVFAHFSGFHGMDIESSAEGSRAAARHLRSHYDMANHAVAAAAHAQAC